MSKRFRHGPVAFSDACAFIALHHRHHKPPHGYRFAIGAWEGERLVGVIVVGRPVSRCFDPMAVAEVTRCCTDGTKDACSFLYGRARAAAAALGFTRLLTYTLPAEGGASLRAAGFQHAATTKGGSWNCPARPRGDHHPTGAKARWELAL